MTPYLPFDYFAMLEELVKAYPADKEPEPPGYDVVYEMVMNEPPPTDKPP